MASTAPRKPTKFSWTTCSIGMPKLVSMVWTSWSGPGVVGGVDAVVGAGVARVPRHGDHGVPGDGQHADLPGGRHDVDDLHDVTALTAGSRLVAVGRLVGRGEVGTGVGADQEHVERGADRRRLQVPDRDLGHLVEPVLHVHVARRDADERQRHDDDPGKEQPVEPGPFVLHLDGAGRPTGAGLPPLLAGHGHPMVHGVSGARAGEEIVGRSTRSGGATDRQSTVGRSDAGRGRRRDDAGQVRFPGLTGCSASSWFSGLPGSTRLQ